MVPSRYKIERRDDGRRSANAWDRPIRCASARPQFVGSAHHNLRSFRPKWCRHPGRCCPEPLTANDALESAGAVLLGILYGSSCLNLRSELTSLDSAAVFFGGVLDLSGMASGAGFATLARSTFLGGCSGASDSVSVARWFSTPWVGSGMVFTAWMATAEPPASLAPKVSLWLAQFDATYPQSTPRAASGRSQTPGRCGRAASGFRRGGS